MRPSPPNRALAARAAPDAGFALIEVVVSALMVGLMAMLLTGVIAAGQTSSDQRNRSQADELAQQDQERLRGMSIEQLVGLDQSRSVTVDNEIFTVHSTGRFLSASTSDTSCSATGSGGADYVGIVSSVTWGGTPGQTTTGGNGRPPVVEQSVISPPKGGSLLTRVTDQASAPLTGARVNATSTGGSNAATTDSYGCTYFATMEPGAYSVSATRSGYVDNNGNSSASTSATVTAGNTATANLKLGQAGAINTTFKTTINGTTYTGQQAPSLSYQNPGMTIPPFANAAPGNPATSISTPQKLFPFTTSTNPTAYTNNYTLWAGKCAANQPPTPPASNASYGTANPGSTTPAVVSLPPVILQVQLKFYYYSTLVTVPIKPDHIVFYQGCDSGFSTYQSWSPPVRSDAILGNGAANPLGALSLPGQPYGGNYFICVDAYGYRAYGGLYANNSFSGSGTTWGPLIIDATSNSNQGTC